MNTLRIVFKEFKQQIRDWKTNVIMILFPIVLMAILGAALSGAFGSRISLSDVKVLYTSTATGPLGVAFDAFRRQAEQTGIGFSQTNDRSAGLSAVRNAAFSCYIVVTNDGITLYRNEKYPLESGIAKSMLAAFLLRYNAVVSVTTHAATGGAAGQVATQGGSYVELQALGGRKTPGSMDFYAVTMLTLIILYGSLFGMTATRMELKLRTGNRILCAPVRRAQFLSGKVLGSLLVIVVQMAIVLLFSHYVFGAYWGKDLLTVGLIILAESFMAVGIGVGVAYLLPSEGAAVGMLNSIIPMLAFFGGSYVPLDMMGDIGAKVGAFSPIKWVNQALFGVIYDGDYSAVAPAVIITISIAAIFVVGASLRARKETN